LIFANSFPKLCGLSAVEAADFNRTVDFNRVAVEMRLKLF